MERGDILYARADVIEEDDTVPPKLVEKAMCRNLHELLKLYAAANTGINRDAIKQLLEINDIKSWLISLCRIFRWITPTGRSFWR